MIVVHVAKVIGSRAITRLAFVLQSAITVQRVGRYTTERLAVELSQLAFACWRKCLAGVRSIIMSMAPHILIVDDDADIRRLVSDYLGEFNLRVSCAQDSQTMRKELAPEGVDLILLDLKRPEEDGMLIARELRPKSDLPI